VSPSGFPQQSVAPLAVASLGATPRAVPVDQPISEGVLATPRADHQSSFYSVTTMAASYWEASPEQNGPRSQVIVDGDES
jgi:hypothetical protein